MLRVVIISIVLAVLGVLYILANPNDAGMRGFGWFLVVIGSIIAGVFTYMWVKAQLAEGGAAAAGGDKTTSKEHRR